MAKKYCVYTNSFIDEKLMNKEHILPKKLGGHLDFSILVDAKTNAMLGSKVDAPFVENAYIKLMSKGYNFTGHSKKITPTFRKSTIEKTGEIVDISLVNNSMVLHKKHTLNSPSWTKTLDECKAGTIKVNFEISFENCVRFFAKALLGAGYYMYGDCFVENCFHEDLRLIMNSDNLSDLENRKKLKTRILCNLENPDPFMHIVTSEIKAFTDFHLVWSSFAQNGVMLGISLFGNPFLSANCIISDNPDAFLSNCKGDVLLKELNVDSQRRLIQTTQEEVVQKIHQTLLKK